ncbi:MAG: AIR carboxylase family protein, partial [Methanomassiliicoccales archaeon]
SSGTLLMVRKGSHNRKIFGRVALITAGTSDVRVAAETMHILTYFGVEYDRYFDCGVAGLHRSIGAAKSILDGDYDVAIVYAGMEGALASVIASLLPIPVIGVPTSNGYGHAGKGESALSSMLQCCVPGLTVLNIDNGVGAAAAAVRILFSMERKKIYSLNSMEESN